MAGRFLPTGNKENAGSASRTSSFDYKFSEDCIYWKGYKPCDPLKNKQTIGCLDCRTFLRSEKKFSIESRDSGSTILIDPIIIIIEAGGLGSILRTSVVAKELKRKFPSYKLLWVTHKNGAELLQNVPSVDETVVYGTAAASQMQTRTYQMVINYESASPLLEFAQSLKTQIRRGFVLNEHGRATVATPAAIEMLRLQTDDEFRMHMNRLPFQAHSLAIADLGWAEQTYDLITKQQDDEQARRILSAINFEDGKQTLVGLNIGSSLRNDAKRWPAYKFYALAERLVEKYPDLNIVILAGPEDKEVYEKIHELNLLKPVKNVHFVGHEQTAGEFISLVNLTDLVVSADTFGLHVAIGLGKPTVGLFGTSPAQEVYTYGNGVNLTLNLSCSPCFAARYENCSNQYRLECMSEITVNQVEITTRNLLDGKVKI